MSEYNKLLDKLQLLYDNEYSEEYFETLGFIAGLMNEIDGNLKGSNLIKEIRHNRLKIFIKFGEYYD